MPDMQVKGSFIENIKSFFAKKAVGFGTTKGAQAIHDIVKEKAPKARENYKNVTEKDGLLKMAADWFKGLFKK